MATDPLSRFNATLRLGTLAMRFRSTRDEAIRRDVAAEYAQEVDRLIASGAWDEVPTFEDQLPDEYMPEAFFEYWTRQ